MQATLTKFGISLLALLLLLQSAAAQPWQFDNVARVVAISDIHGAYGAMLQTLQRAAVIDNELAWSGGDTHLVIVGDIVDRGPESRKVMDLLMRLEPEAAAAGGMLHVLIGNHEAMNMSGDLRYVSAAEYAAFAGEETAAERERWFALFRSKRASPEADELQLRAEFEQQFPAGYFAHRHAFSPDGKYGRWLLTKPVIIVIDGTAFVHGGLPPLVTEQGLQGINGTLVGELGTYLRAVQSLVDREILLPTDADYQHVQQLRDFAPAEGEETGPDVAAAIAEVLRLADSPLQAPDGPLWYRQEVYCSKLIEADRLDQSLAAIGARRVVIGHTPTYGRQVLERFDGRVYEVDTGILAAYYKGSGNALIIEAERLYVINQASAEAIEPTPHPRQVGDRPGAPMLVADIEQVLRNGEITARRTDAAGRVIVTLHSGEYSIDAEFTKRARAGVYPELAAYRLDRLLQLDMVPATVQRTIDGDDGSLQFVPVRWIDEQRRQEQQSGGAADCPLPEQWNAMMIFDTLLGNELRTAETLRYDASSFQVLLVGHERAFSTSGSKPVRYKDVPMTTGAAWKTALAALSDDVLQQQFADVLDKRRIKALAQRRDLLLSE